VLLERELIGERRERRIDRLAGAGRIIRIQGSAMRALLRVDVGVTTENSIKSEIASCINRELRSLGDVVLTDSRPHVRVGVVAVMIEVPGRVTGYTFSVVVSKPIPDAFKSLLLSGYRGREKAAKVILLKDQESITNHFVRIGSDLPTMCNQLVADIDSHDLEIERKTYQNAVDMEESY